MTVKITGIIWSDPLHKNYFLDIVDKKPALLTAMLRFNGVGPDETATPPDSLAMMYPNVPVACLEELWRHPPARSHLRTITPAPADPFWDFSEESRCLALLDPGTLDELALFYGASLHAPDITRTIMGADVARLREALGWHIHAYALHRGQYQMPAGRNLFTPRHREIPLAERVAQHGREALGIIVSGWPQPLQHRVRIVPPTDLEVSDSLRRRIWFDVKKILIKEVDSGWAHCFA